jgi:type IV secretion system protein VirD4
MSFRSAYSAHRAALGGAATGTGGGGKIIGGGEAIIGGGKPSGFYAGCYRDPKTGATGPEIWFPWLDPVLIVGRNRSGKDTGLICMNALLTAGNITSVFQDTRLEVAAITAPRRRELGPADVANSFGQLVETYPDLRSSRVNLLKAPELHPSHPLCFEHACALAEAIVPQNEKDNPFFPLSAQALAAGLIKAELIQAARETRDATILNVRLRATEAEEFDETTGEPTKGLRAYIRRIIDEYKDEQINSMLGGFAGEQSDGMRDVVATFAANTRWMLSRAIIEDEKDPQIDFARLGQTPMTLYYGIEHTLVKPFEAYLRLFLTSLMKPLFAPHPVPVRIFLNEFAAMGRVPIVESSLGLVAGCSIQLVFVVQSLAQLKQHYGDGWETFLGQAGAVILVGSPGDEFSCQYLAKHSGELTMRQPNVGLNMNNQGIGLSAGEGFGRRQYLMPQDLRNLRRGEGFIWVAGLNDPIPAIFPPYFEHPATKHLARRNPYYHG